MFWFIMDPFIVVLEVVFVHVTGIFWHVVHPIGVVFCVVFLVFNFRMIGVPFIEVLGIVCDILQIFVIIFRI